MTAEMSAAQLVRITIASCRGRVGLAGREFVRHLTDEAVTLGGQLLQQCRNEPERLNKVSGTTSISARWKDAVRVQKGLFRVRWLGSWV
jgi:hypothetical protein